MKTQVWIVVANKGICSFYLAKNVNTLVKLNTIEHAESHLTGKDLIADKEGRVTERKGWGTNTVEEKFPPKRKEAFSFAKEVASYLESGCKKNEMDKCYLIAPPAFLGILRQHLGAATSKKIAGEVTKDLTHLKPDKLLDYLPPVL